MRFNLNLFAMTGFCICPGSGFVYLHTDPDPTFIMQIRIQGSGSASLVKRNRLQLFFWTIFESENPERIFFFFTGSGAD